MNTAVAVADAVVAALNASPFDVAFTAQRTYQPNYELADLAELRVTVVPSSVELAPYSRNAVQLDCAVDVGVQKRVGTDTEIDELLELAEAIGDRLRQEPLAGFPQAKWVATEHGPLVAAQHLEQHRVMTSVMTVTYRVGRE